MFCILCVFVVLWYNFPVSNTHILNQFISKSINITTVIGETVTFNCLEFMESKEFVAPEFEWFKNGESFHEMKKYYERVSLDKFGEILKITNVENKDQGIYVCALSYQFQCIYSMFTLTVENLTNVEIHKMITSNEIRRIGGSTIWYCFELEGTEYNVDQYIWYKNGEPLRVEDSDNRISLEYENQILTYKSLRYEDNGSYECHASNRFRIDSSVYNLNVVESSANMFYNYHQANITRHIGDIVKWSCYLSVTHTNDNSLHYKWFKNDVPVQMSKNDMHITLSEAEKYLSINKVTSNDTGNYSCVATNGSITNFKNVNLIVMDKPNKLLHRWYTSNMKLLVGVTLQLKCITLHSTKHYNTWFSWKKNDRPLVLMDDNKIMKLKNNDEILELRDITVYEKGKYECEAENDYHKMYSAYELNVVEPAAPIIYNSSNTTISVYLNESVQLFCYVKGIPSPKISWFKNGDPFYVSKNKDRILLQDCKQKLLFLFTKIEDDGNYGCIVMNNIGSNISNSKLTIKIIKDLINNEENYSVWNIFIIFFVILLGGILTICCVMSLRREKALKKELKAHKLKFLNGDIEKWNADLSIEEQTDLLPYDKQWEFPKKKLKLGKQLGSGAFGVVFKADAIGISNKTTSTTVAVKMVKPNSDSSHTKALISELKIMIHIGRHLNIVNLLGACTEDITNNLMVIIEYCRFGSVREYLLKQRDSFINQITPDGSLKSNNEITLEFFYNQNDSNNINSHHSEDNILLNDSKDYKCLDDDEQAWCNNYHGDFNDIIIPPLCTHDLICWSFQIARGMEYLSSKKVLHGDLAVRNILLTDNNVVKICDFGLAKTIHNYDMYKMSKKVPLPVKWMAIESLRDQVFSSQSDVWSFGILLWELFSLAETPYPNIKSYDDLYDRLISGYRMNQPQYANLQIYNIMYDCWKLYPNSRPSFTNLTERISDLLQTDSKSYYVNLNAEYITMNAIKSHSTDYINLMSTPNRWTMNDKNYGDLSPKNSNDSENKEELEMNLLVHNQNYLLEQSQTQTTLN